MKVGVPSVLKGIAPSQKEGALTPRCLPKDRKTCQLESWPSQRSQGYRAVAKRRSAYAAMPSQRPVNIPTRKLAFPAFSRVSRRRTKKERLRRDAFPKASEHANLKVGVPSVLKGIAPSQKEGALTPRCLPKDHKTCQLESWRSQRSRTFPAFPGHEPILCLNVVNAWSKRRRAVSAV